MSSTPLLDREQPLPKRKLSTAWSIFLGFVLGLILIALDENVFPGVSAITSLSLERWLVLLMGLYAVVLVHELGHLLAGIASGFEIRGVNVGALLLTKKARGWRLRFVPARLIGGGFVAVTPRSDENLRGRFIRFAIGGPAATALLFIVLLFLPDSFTVRALFAINLLTVGLTFIPFTAAGQPTDAKTVLILSRKDPTAERLTAILYLLALDRQGVQPRDWPVEYVQRISIATADSSNRPSSLVLRLAHASEGNDSEAIASVLESALAASHKMWPDTKRGFFVAASCFHAIARRDLTLAEAWLDSARRVKGTASLKDWDSKALAGVCLANGQYSEARELLKRYLDLLDRQPASGMVTAERTRTLNLLKEVSEQAA